MAEPSSDPLYYGLTLAQFRERIKKIAVDKGLQGEKLERITAKALELIPMIRLDDAAQR